MASSDTRFGSAAMDVGAGGASPTKVLILIPTLDIGGAEMDLARNLPRIDRSRFKVVVWAFAWRGEMASDLLDAGIEVIGPGAQERAWPTGAASKGQGQDLRSGGVSRGQAGTTCASRAWWRPISATKTSTFCTPSCRVRI